MNMNRSRKQRQAGLTLIEIAIASVIMAVLFAIAMVLLTRSSKHVETEQVNLHLEMEAREVVNQIALDLRQTRLTMLVNPATSTAITPNDSTTATYASTLITYPYPDLQFRMPGAGFSLSSYKTDPDSLWTRRVRYRWAAETGETATDGVDNDRNGLVDEGVIKKTEDVLNSTGAVVSTKTTTICHFVQKNGLQFWVPATGPGRVQVTLTLEKVDTSAKNKKITKTVQTTIDMRN